MLLNKDRLLACIMILVKLTENWIRRKLNTPYGKQYVQSDIYNVLHLKVFYNIAGSDINGNYIYYQDWK